MNLCMWWKKYKLVYEQVSEQIFTCDVSKWRLWTCWKIGLTTSLSTDRLVNGGRLKIKDFVTTQVIKYKY